MKNPIQIVIEPSEEELDRVLQRPGSTETDIRSSVQEIIDTVRKQGDSAVLHYTQKFDGITLSSIAATQAEIRKQAETIPAELRLAIEQAYANIYAFHAAQLKHQKEEAVETQAGVVCWRERRAVSRVGLYVPGGTAPLFSTVLMLGIPAQIAGCSSIVLASPPTPEGSIHPAAAFAAELCGIDTILKAGGAHSIAAMAYGTETVDRVDKIFGPGNQYVTLAKQLASMDAVAVDMPAGPSEVMVSADGSALPEYIAADMLSQAEHGMDSQSIAIVDDQKTADAVMKAVERQLVKLPRKEFLISSLSKSVIICRKSRQGKIDIINQYAPEHLIIHMENPEEAAVQVKNAGSVFLGPWTPESAGDYASGTNHTLPTSGWAKSFSGIGIESYQKIISFQKISKDGLSAIGPVIKTLAAAEGLEAHKEAVSIRLNQLGKEELSSRNET